jgi:hypothetical protein
MDKGQGYYGNQMQVKDLDGNSCHWQLIGNIAHGSVQNKSSLHLQARELIHTCFPTLQVLEEIPVNIRRSETLYLDFYLPLIKKCIEVHGEQHYKFSRFFHNGIEYIELPFDQIDQWESRIKNEH